MRPTIWMAAVTCAGMAAVSGCGGPSSTTQADPVSEVFRRQAQEEQLTRTETDGKRLFGQYCATCHGDTGAGDGQNAFNLDPAPPDFEESLSSTDVTYWRQVVDGGTASVGRSPLCPPWGRTLRPTDIDAIIAFLAVLARPGSPTPEGDQAPAAGTSR